MFLDENSEKPGFTDLLELLIVLNRNNNVLLVNTFNLKKEEVHFHERDKIVNWIQ